MSELSKQQLTEILPIDHPKIPSKRHLYKHTPNTHRTGVFPHFQGFDSPLRSSPCLKQPDSFSLAVVPEPPTKSECWRPLSACGAKQAQRKAILLQ
jgi:hypothetical protein